MTSLRSANRTLFLAISIAALSACGGGAAPDEGGSDEDTTAAATTQGGDLAAIIEERQENYETIGDEFKAIRGELDKDSPDLALVSSSATKINASAQKISGFFPEGTSVDDGFETEALATIWEKPSEFEASTQKLIEVSVQMASLADAGDLAGVKAQVGAVGGSCKGCHETFRLDTD